MKKKPVKKTAPAKKAAPKKAKPAASRRHEAAGKRTNHVPAKKPAKKVAPKLKKPVAKAKKPAKPVAKTAAKAKAKAAPKKVVKAAKPAKPVKPVATKKIAPPAKTKAPAKEVAVKAAKIVPVKEAPPAKVPKVKPEKLTKAEKAAKAAAAAAPAEIFPALDPSVKRPAKPFFLEVKPGVERVIKRGDKSAASPVLDIQARRKGPAAEESSEELAERIERELQSQSFLKRNRMRPQLCTKCGINAVAPRFTIDRELGYCDPCAEILHLGETKEARRMEFNLALKKEDPEAEAAPIDGPPADLEDEPLPEDLVD
jgi:hypothetical protein